MDTEDITRCDLSQNVELLIGIGLLITEEPSHATRHTDHVPRRFG
jgi:hypothetical protein